MSLIKNLQQITMAVYMVTDCVEEAEPLRYQAREAMLNAMKAIAHIMGNIQMNSGEFRSAHSQVLLVREYVSILEIMGYVSSMNASILVAQIDRFIARLDTSILDTDSPHKARVPLRSDMSFGIDLGELFYHKNTDAITDGHTSENGLLSHQFNAQSPSDFNPRNTQNNAAQQSLGKLEKEMGRLQRRSLILKLFRELPSNGGFKELTLSELVEKYGRYGGEGPISEKTIQRELVELTQDGTLEKVGSKRWVRYRLLHTAKL